MANQSTSKYSGSANLLAKKGSKKTERFWEIDFIRGICVLLLIFDHSIQLMNISSSDTLYDFLLMYLSNPLQIFLHSKIRALFFLICGVSSVLSRSNFRRGIQLGGIACFITFITLLSNTMDSFYGVTIYFGVLHMLAVAILVCAVLGGLIKHIPRVGKYIPLLFGFFIIGFYYFYVEGKWGDPTLGVLPALFGYRIDLIMTADFCALFPEMGYVLIGFTIGHFYKTKYKDILKPLDGAWNKPVCFLGRHALIIYLLQPLILAVVYAFI